MITRKEQSSFSKQFCLSLFGAFAVAVSKCYRYRLDKIRRMIYLSISVGPTLMRVASLARFIIIG